MDLISLDLEQMVGETLDLVDKFNEAFPPDWDYVKEKSHQIPRKPGLLFRPSISRDKNFIKLHLISCRSMKHDFNELCKNIIQTRSETEASAGADAEWINSIYWFPLNKLKEASSISEKLGSKKIPIRRNESLWLEDRGNSFRIYFGPYETIGNNGFTLVRELGPLIGDEISFFDNIGNHFDELCQKSEGNREIIFNLSFIKNRDLNLEKLFFELKLLLISGKMIDRSILKANQISFLQELSSIRKLWIYLEEILGMMMIGPC